MKRLFLALALFFAVAIAYAIWPFVGLMKIADAISRRDALELSARIIVPELKRSLIDQVALEYLKISGRDRRLSQLEVNLALGVARALADQYVTDMLQPEALFELLRERTALLSKPGGLVAPRLEAPNLRNLSMFLQNVDYAGSRFYVWMPFNSDRQTGYRLQLRLSAWTWKLAGLDLPEDVRIRIANELEQRSRTGDRPG
jgi:hypothetical protein